MHTSSARTLANICLFQAGWWGVVLGAARGYAWLGVPIVAVIAVIHFLFISTQRRLDLLLALYAVLLGTIADTAAAVAGAITFHQSPWPPPLAPPFMLALWINFAFTLTTTLRWLQQRYAAAALLGVLGGPLAYYSGARLGALALAPRPLAAALAVIALEWLAAMLLLLRLWNIHDNRLRRTIS